MCTRNDVMEIPRAGMDPFASGHTVFGAAAGRARHRERLRPRKGVWPSELNQNGCGEAHESVVSGARGAKGDLLEKQREAPGRASRGLAGTKGPLLARGGARLAAGAVCAAALVAA